MTTDSKMKPDFRAPTESKRIPKAVADGIGGMILGVAEVEGTPEQVFRALTTNEGCGLSIQPRISARSRRSLNSLFTKLN